VSANEGRRVAVARAATAALGAVAALVAVDLAVALVWHSLGALAEAARVATRLLLEIAAAVTQRGEPRVRRVPVRAGVVEGGLVAAVGVVVGVAALANFGDQPVRPLLAGVVMAAAAVGAGAAAVAVERAARRTGSRAVADDVGTLRAAAISGGLVAGALGLVAATGQGVFDPLAALAIAAVILYAGVGLASGRSGGTASAREVEVVGAVLAAGPPEVIGYGQVRGRTVAGARRLHVEVVLRPDTSQERARAIAQEVAAALRARLADTDVRLHLRKPYGISRPARRR
jgi:divalent metal cation (Fe/Co/Zn/Cd) transporter